MKKAALLLFLMAFSAFAQYFPPTGVPGMPGTIPIVAQAVISPINLVGLNDLTASVTATSIGHRFNVVIDTTGTPDTFKWREDDGSLGASIPISGAAQALADGVAITFPVTTGHTVDDEWLITTQSGLEIQTNRTLKIGPTPAIIPNDANYFTPDILVSNTGASAGQRGGTASFFIGNGSGYDFLFHGSRGTPQAPTALINGDYVQLAAYLGYDGVVYRSQTTDLVAVDGPASPGTVPLSRCLQSGASGLTLRSSGNIEVYGDPFSCFSGGADVGYRRAAANLFEINAGTLGTGRQICATPIAVGSLASCTSSIEGSICDVTDSNTATWGATVANGGGNHVQARCNGTNWTVVGK
jgi:hypothetical protein